MGGVVYGSDKPTLARCITAMTWSFSASVSAERSGSAKVKFFSGAAIFSSILTTSAVLLAVVMRLTRGHNSHSLQATIR